MTKLALLANIWIHWGYNHKKRQTVCEICEFDLEKLRKRLNFCHHGQVFSVARMSDTSDESDWESLRDHSGFQSYSRSPPVYFYGKSRKSLNVKRTLAFDNVESTCKSMISTPKVSKAFLKPWIWTLWRIFRVSWIW